MGAPKWPIDLHGGPDTAPKPPTRGATRETRVAPRTWRFSIPLTVLTTLEHSHGDVDRFDHAFVVRDTLPGAVERRSVIDRDAQKRKAHRDVHAGETRPAFRFV